MSPEQVKRQIEKMELVGMSDIARMLGWTTQKVSSYRSQNIKEFPEPITEIGGRPIWTKNQIRAWRGRL